MCKCTPEIRTPFCGRHGCEIPQPSITQEEPPPVKNNLPAVWDLVVADMQARDRIGEDRYNTRLQPHNGRNALRDAYYEALDLAVYLRQAIYEVENNP
jgi:hypothetical protein